MELPAHVTMQSNGVGTVSFGTDQNLNVLFHNHAVIDPVKSREAGRPTHSTHIYVRIQHPGERDFVHRPAHDGDRQRFPSQWAAFVRNQAHIPDGTPIDQLFPDRPDITANLRTAGVHTVEQLASLTGEGISRMGMGAQDYVNRAQKYLSVSEKGSAFHKMQREIEDWKGKFEVQNNQLMMMSRQIEALMAERSGASTKTLLPIQAQASIAAQAAPVWRPQELTMASVDPGAFDGAMQQMEQVIPALPPLEEAAVSATSETNIATPKRRGRPPGARNKTTKEN